MTNKEFYQETFSQVQSSTEIRWEDMKAMKSKRQYPKRLLTIAAVVAILTALTGIAVATHLFGLRDLLLSEKQEIHLDSQDTSQKAQNMDTISLAGYAGTPECQATVAWQAFLNGYDQDGSIIDEIGNSIFSPGSSYTYYQVYTQEMADTLDEIVATYHLKLHTNMLDDLYTNDALCDQVGGDFLGENQAYSTYMYEDGTFKFDGEIDLPEYGTLNYQFMRCVRGSFTDVTLNIGNITDYTEWSYATESGVPVTLALASHQALVIVELPDSFVTINVLAGTETPVEDTFSNGSLTAEHLEHFADSFDFSLLTPVQSADDSLPRPTLDEVLGRPSAEDFVLQTGVEEGEAQSFYADFLYLLENGDRRAVAENIRYPACVTVWKSSESGKYLAEIPVASAEEFLPYYDEIFTEGLWEDIMTTRYDMQRADMIPHNGMMGAAGGAIWFAALEDGSLAVLTIQNDEGCSIRQNGSSSVTVG